MITIKVLGPGCSDCTRLEQAVTNVVNHLGIDAHVESVTDFADIMHYPLIATPALVINETLMSSGRIPTEAEINGWLSRVVTSWIQGTGSSQWVEPL